MKPKLIPILIAGLFAPALAQAQGQEPQREVTGSVSLGVRHTGLNANDPSKFQEYRDIESGTQLLGGFELRRRGERDYFDAYFENIGHDDQYLDARGGRYGAYKFRLFTDSMRHNFGSGPGARSPYVGIGSDTLTATLPNLNVSTWNTFNHSYTRRNFGGFAELQATSPWYFRVDANEVKREGINVLAGAKGTSPGNGFMDLPAPIDYTTRNYSGEVGYTLRNSHVAVSLMHSSFDNGSDVLRWSNDFFNPAGGLFDTTVRPPSNELTRLAMNGNLRQLPMDSTLAGRFTHSQLTNDVTLQQTMLTATSLPTTFNVIAPTNPSDATFRGDIKNTTASLSLASRPAAAVDTRLHWNYARQKNDSTEMTFNPAVNSGLRLGSTDPTVNCANAAGVLCRAELFHYKKNNLGAEAGYRVSRTNKFSGGVDYAHTDRERADFQSTKDLKFFAEWKNSSLDWLTSRVKYQFLNRRSDFAPDVSTLNANPMDLFVRRFDFANVQQNLVKVALDAVPGGGFDLGLEAIFKDNNYKDTLLGRTADQRQEYYASVGWGDPKSLRVLGFTDIEYTKFDSSHRVGTGNPDPSSGSNATTYNWSAKNKDYGWQAGIGVDWAPLTRLTVKGSLLQAQTTGSADFSVAPGGPALNSLGLPFPPIRNFDNTRRTALTLRGVYDFSRHWEFTGGYAFERYRYSDIGYDNSRYVVPAAASAACTPATTCYAYTTGQFAFQPYTANIVFALAKYKF